MQDEALRQEVRGRLRLPVITALGADLTGPGSGDRAPAEVAELLAAAIAAADDPVAVLETAATDARSRRGRRSGTVPERRAAAAGSRTPAGKRGQSAGTRSGRPEPEAAPQGAGSRGAPRSPCAGSCGTSRRRPGSSGAS